MAELAGAGDAVGRIQLLHIQSTTGECIGEGPLEHALGDPHDGEVPRPQLGARLLQPVAELVTQLLNVC